MAKYLLFALATIVCALSCSSNKQMSAVSDTENWDIYLVIGQSNMAGRAEIRQEDQQVIDNVYLYTGISIMPWEAAKNPMNKYSSIRKNIEMQRLGPSYSFAQSMHEATPNKKIGLVVNAKGGTRIAQWLPGTKFFSDAVSRTRIALKSGTLKGIIWHQGESDSDEIRRNLYLGRLEELVHGLREAFDAPNLPFVLGEVYATEKREPINIILSKVPGFIKNTALVSSAGTSTPDDTHFDAPSAILMGQRYAEKMLELQLDKSGN